MDKATKTGKAIEVEELTQKQLKRSVAAMSFLCRLPVHHKSLSFDRHGNVVLDLKRALKLDKSILPLYRFENDEIRRGATTDHLSQTKGVEYLLEHAARITLNNQKAAERILKDIVEDNSKYPRDQQAFAASYLCYLFAGRFIDMSDSSLKRLPRYSEALYCANKVLELGSPLFGSVFQLVRDLDESNHDMLPYWREENPRVWEAYRLECKHAFIQSERYCARCKGKLPETGVVICDGACKFPHKPRYCTSVCFENDKKNRAHDCNDAANNYIDV